MVGERTMVSGLTGSGVVDVISIGGARMILEVVHGSVGRISLTPFTAGNREETGAMSVVVAHTEDLVEGEFFLASACEIYTIFELFEQRFDGSGRVPW